MQTPNPKTIKSRKRKRRRKERKKEGKEEKGKKEGRRLKERKEGSEGGRQDQLTLLSLPIPHSFCYLGKPEVPPPPLVRSEDVLSKMSPATALGSGDNGVQNREYSSEGSSRVSPRQSNWT